MTAAPERPGAAVGSRTRADTQSITPRRRLGTPTNPGQPLAHRPQGGHSPDSRTGDAGAASRRGSLAPPLLARAEYPDPGGERLDQNAADIRVSRRGESHPPPLSGPDVTVSRHPAPTVRPAVNATSCQWANRPGLYWYAFCSQAIALAYLPRNRLNLCMAQRARCSLVRHARKRNSER